MSWAIHLQSFQNGKISKFSRSIIWDVYGPKALLNAEGWGLTYDGIAAGVLILDDDDPTDGFSIRRPGRPAIRDMYEVARQVPCLINWDDNSAVADERFIAGIPDWLLNALAGRPHIIHSGDDLLKCLEQN
jgi:hypothetical protein